jgi:hypothetical protein
MKTECINDGMDMKKGRWRTMQKQLEAGVEIGLIMGLPPSAMLCPT